MWLSLNKCTQNLFAPGDHLELKKMPLMEFQEGYLQCVFIQSNKNEFLNISACIEK